MTVMPREAWTDERLDDLKDGMHREFGQVRTEMKAGFDKVDDRFDKVDSRFDKVDSRFDKVDSRFDKVDSRFDKVEARFGKVDDRFDKLEDRFAALNRTLIGGAIALCAAVLAAGLF